VFALFLNAGLFHDGDALRACAASMPMRSWLPGWPRMLFGRPTRASRCLGTAIMLAERGRNVPFAFNRKEAKDHGEGGTLIGAPLAAAC